MENLNELIKRPNDEPIDEDTVTKILSEPPFIHIDGLINARDISNGTLPTLKQGYAYRSGTLETLSDAGKAQLQALGIRKILDLRSADEVAAFPDPAIAGIGLVATNVGREWNRAAGETGAGEVGGNLLASLYVQMLETNPETFRALLLHVRDRPDEPFLFHCTAGKDRTGAAAALLLLLAGAPSAYIAHDFALTRIGFEPARELLTFKLTGGKEVDEGMSWKLETFGSSRAEVMEAFLRMIGERYGGVGEAVRGLFGFGEEDVERMKAHLASW